MTGIGNEAQTRMIAEQVAEAAVENFVRKYPQPTKTDIPAPLKWAAGIITALMTAATIGMCFWVVNTLSTLQDTVTRIDERQKLTGDVTSQRLDTDEGRISRLEGFHSMPMGTGK